MMSGEKFRDVENPMQGIPTGSVNYLLANFVAYGRLLDDTIDTLMDELNLREQKYLGR